MKETCASMQPCKGEIAELHNQRLKELDYIRKDLTDQNTYVVWTTVKEQMQKIRSEYKRVTGQKLQPSARPLQEIMVVIDENTNSTHIEKFCELLKRLGMTPLSYAIHRDEGHHDTITGEWIPNYHAHIIVDTTCWENRTVWRTKKRGGKNIIDTDTGKPEKVEVNGYAKTIKFTRRDMSRLQDFAAEATGLKRGTSSDRKHLNSLEYKVNKLADEVKRLTGITESQKAEIEAHENQIRGHVTLLQHRGKEILRTFDDQARGLSESGFPVDAVVQEHRNILSSATEEDVTELQMPDLVERITLLSENTVDVAIATTVMVMTEVDGLKKKIDERRSVLAELTVRIKHISIWAAIKGALNTLLGRPVNRQIGKVMRENEEQGKALTVMSGRVAELEQASARSSKDREDLEQMIVHQDKRIHALIGKDDGLKETIRKQDTKIRHLEAQRLGEMRRRNKQIAENLLDNATPEQIQQYERQGLLELIGDDIWTETKATIEYRRGVREYQQRHGHRCGSVQSAVSRDNTPSKGTSRSQ